MPNRKIAVLMTCFNRVETTLCCLNHLFVCERPDGVVLEVWLVDDASPDGTGRKIKEAYPSVNVIKGTGKLYWCAGMRLAWKMASQSNDYDGYLWLNDDTLLFNQALTIMLSELEIVNKLDGKSGIVCGAICACNEKYIAYGGRSKQGGLIEPSGEIQAVHTMNGNCVLIPNEIFKKVGNFLEYFSHALGDFDYGLRAKKNGFSLYTTSKYVGMCDDKNPMVGWIDPTISFRKRLKILYSPKGSATPPVFFRFVWNHHGLASAVKALVSQHIRVCFPRLWGQTK